MLRENHANQKDLVDKIKEEKLKELEQISIPKKFMTDLRKTKII